MLTFVIIICAIAVVLILVVKGNGKQNNAINEDCPVPDKPKIELKDIGLRLFGDEPNIKRLTELYDEKKYFDLKMESFEMVRKAWEEKNSTHPKRSDDVYDTMMFAYQFNTAAAYLMYYRDLMNGDVSDAVVEIMPAQAGSCKKDGGTYSFVEFYNNMANELHNVYFPCEGCPMIDNCIITIRPS